MIEADGHARVQRRIGVLEDHLHAAAIGGQRLFTEVGDILPVEENPAVRRLIQANKTAADRRFAAAALADEAEGFALLNGKAHVVHGLEQPFGLAAERAADGEIHFKPAGFYNRAHSRFPSSNDARRAFIAAAGSARNASAKAGSSPAGRCCRCSWHTDSAPRTDSPAAAQSGRAASPESESACAFRRMCLRDGAQQPPRVGMLRLVEDLANRAFLHDDAAVHDQHAASTCPR